MGRRRQARELALQALYFLDARPDDPQGALALFHRNFTPPRKAREFMDRLVRGVLDHQARIDAVVERFRDELVADFDKRLIHYDIVTDLDHIAGFLAHAEVDE